MTLEAHKRIAAACVATVALVTLGLTVAAVYRRGDLLSSLVELFLLLGFVVLFLAAAWGVVARLLKSDGASPSPLRFGSRHGLGAAFLMAWLVLGTIGVGVTARFFLMLGGLAFWFALTGLEKGPLA